MSSAEEVGESAAEAFLPGWINKLRPLAPVAGALATVATNPEKWVRNNLVDVIQEVVAEWFVGGILDAAQYVIGWILFVFERTISIILDTVPEPLLTPMEVTTSAVNSAIVGIFDGVRGVAESAGLAGPPAWAFAFLLTSLMLIAVLYAMLKLIPGSDAVEGALEGLR